MKMSSKKLIVLLMMSVIVSTFIACSNNIDEKTESESNMKNDRVSIFDESFYKDLKAVSLVGTDIIIEKEEIIDEIKQLILNVPHSKSDEDIFDYYGTTVLVLMYNDGSSKTISMTGKLILDLGETYTLENNICSEIRAFFNSELQR